MAEPISLSAVAQALGLLDGGGHHVAIVGGGGKTTLAFALADQLTGATVVTSTTKMGADERGGLPMLLSPRDDEVRAAATTSPILVLGRVDGHKAIGVSPSDCDRWFRLVDHVIVEADGSRKQPFKSPGALEPVVPATTTTMVSMIGAHAMGRVIADRCHRPLRVAALAGCRPSARLTPAAAAAVLLHERGARRTVPAGARFAVVVNQVDGASRVLADELVARLVEREPGLVVVAVAVATHPSRNVRGFLR